MEKKYRITSGQLANIPPEVISPADKARIEEAVLEDGGSLTESINIELRQGIRAYLVNSIEELDINDKLREEFPSMAAQFADGWLYSRRC